jgi:hypothetical protein
MSKEVDCMQDQVNEPIEVSNKIKFYTLSAYAVFILFSSFLFNGPLEILWGMGRIAIAPSILVTDYIQVGNLGAALFNCGLLMLICMFIIKVSKTEIKGAVIAAVITVGAFALFGKNIYNIWSILLGFYLHSHVKKEKFSTFIVVALFGTALAPVVSQISFGLELPLIQGLILGNAAGIIIGFILPPLAKCFFNFHGGFNLYNVGFTAGVVGTFFMAIIRSLNFDNKATLIIAEGYNHILSVYLMGICISMMILGFILNGNSIKGFGTLLKRSGRATDFVKEDGFGVTLINMGTLGVMAMSYVLLVKGQLNGPIVGGILTIVAFGAFGKHIKNCLPILIGVFIAASLQKWEVNATGPLLAALFGTTLAPIAGQYGWESGIIAGLFHMTLVMNVGFAHGGMNLYNNGFAGGFVGATLIPLLDSFAKGLIPIRWSVLFPFWNSPVTDELYAKTQQASS